MPELTAQQAAFVHHFTSTVGAIGNAAEAARQAGYSERSAKEIGRQLLDKPHVQAAIDEANRVQISGPIAVKAAALLQRVIDDEEAPLKLRVEAAKTILDRAGIVAPTAAEWSARRDKQDFETMTAAEIGAFRARMAGEIAQLRTLVGETIEHAPDAALALPAPRAVN
jgi:hypothetical protein